MDAPAAAMTSEMEVFINPLVEKSLREAWMILSFSVMGHLFNLISRQTGRSLIEIKVHMELVGVNCLEKHVTGQLPKSCPLWLKSGEKACLRRVAF